jgi:hypothetical protein
MKKTVAENNGTGPPQADKPASGGQARLRRIGPHSPSINLSKSDFDR